jgi:hypothetical protein
MRSLQLALAGSIVLATASASAQNCPARPMWPTSGWPSRTEEIAALRASEIA